MVRIKRVRENNPKGKERERRQKLKGIKSMREQAKMKRNIKRDGKSQRKKAKM